MVCESKSVRSHNHYSQVLAPPWLSSTSPTHYMIRNGKLEPSPSRYEGPV